MKRLFLPALLTACLLGRPAAAQTAPAASSPAPISASQQQLAAKLLSLFYSENSFDQLIEQTLQMQLQAHPEVKPYEGEMRTFFKKYMSWAALKDDMAVVYAREFSEADLREMIRFYESPVGRRTAAKLPIIMQKGMEIGQRRVQEHILELQQAIAEKAKQQN